MAHRTERWRLGGQQMMLWAGILAAAAYWIVEAVVHTFVFENGTIGQQLIPVDLNELWMRSLVCLLFISFGAFAHVVSTRINRARLEQQRLQKRLEEALTKVLSGYLPICASCKRIRMDDSDSERDSSWHQVESYLSQRTDLEFTHSICPACDQALYGEQREQRSDAYEI
jgi:hypothetical protein